MHYVGVEKTSSVAADIVSAAPVGCAVRQASGLAKRVLVVDDHEIGQELICMMLGRLGVAADKADDGLQALAMVQHAEDTGNPYALVLMDFMMPGLDGVSATRIIRESGFAASVLPVIGVTAFADPSDYDRFVDAGGQSCLSKPISQAQLAQTITAWLDSDTAVIGHEPFLHHASLHQRYQARKLATFARIAAAITAKDTRIDTLVDIRDLLHKLAGTASLFGDAALSEAAANYENDLIAATDDTVLDVLVHHLKPLAAAA
jgi:CheY-like chemotaxis protein